MKIDTCFKINNLNSKRSYGIKLSHEEILANIKKIDINIRKLYNEIWNAYGVFDLDYCLKHKIYLKNPNEFFTKEKCEELSNHRFPKFVNTQNFLKRFVIGYNVFIESEKINGEKKNYISYIDESTPRLSSNTQTELQFPPQDNLSDLPQS